MPSRPRSSWTGEDNSGLDPAGSRSRTFVVGLRLKLELSSTADGLRATPIASQILRSWSAGGRCDDGQCGGCARLAAALAVLDGDPGSDSRRFRSPDVRPATSAAALRASAEPPSGATCRSVSRSIRLLAVRVRDGYRCSNLLAHSSTARRTPRGCPTGGSAGRVLGGSGVRVRAGFGPRRVEVRSRSCCGMGSIGGRSNSETSSCMVGFGLSVPNCDHCRRSHVTTSGSALLWRSLGQLLSYDPWRKLI